MKNTLRILLVILSLFVLASLSACKVGEETETSSDTKTESASVSDTNFSETEHITDSTDLEPAQTEDTDLETDQETSTSADSEENTTDVTTDVNTTQTLSEPKTESAETSESDSDSISKNDTPTEDTSATDKVDETVTQITPQPPPVTPPKKEVVNPTAAMIEAIEAQFFNLVNEERAICGLVPLMRNDVLDRAADLRAEECFELFSHTRPNGTSCFSVFDESEYAYDYYAVGENITKTTNFGNNYITEDLIFIGTDEQLTAIAEHLFQNFKNSPPHYSSMISGEFCETGVGVATEVDKENNILHITCCNFFGAQQLS